MDSAFHPVRIFFLLVLIFFIKINERLPDFITQSNFNLVSGVLAVS